MPVRTVIAWALIAFAVGCMAGYAATHGYLDGKAAALQAKGR